VVSLFKERSPVSVFWLIVLCFGLHVYSLVNPPQVTAEPVEGFFYYLLNPLKNADTYLVSLAYVFIIFLTALQLNYILNSLRMFSKPSYTPALAFLLFSALLPSFNVINPALITCNFLIWILYRACKLYAAPNPKTSIYNFGLLTGLCFIFYYPSIPLVLFAIIALIIIRPFRLNEWFVLFFGIITPVYFLVTYLFLNDQLNLISLPQYVFSFMRLPVQPLFIIISLTVSALATLWGILLVQNTGVNVLIQVRKSWSVFLALLMLLIPVFFFVHGAYPAALLLVMVPAACYAGFMFSNSRNILPVVFFWLLVALAVYNNWFAKY
jgi:hypothetical protein